MSSVPNGLKRRIIKEIIKTVPTQIAGGSTKCSYCDCFISNDEYYAAKKIADGANNFSPAFLLALLTCQKCGHLKVEHKLFL